MNNIFTRSVLLLALFSPWVNASTDENCNTEDGLGGWAIWCGVDTYLAQQEPTAAGPIEVAFEGVVEPDVRTVAFGGALLDTPPEVEYNWQGYAMLTHPDFGGLQAGELKLKVDTVTGEVIGLLTTASGQEIVFNEGAKFYVAPELIQVINSPFSPASEAAGAVQISQFEVASEGSLLKLVTFPQSWRFSDLGNPFDPEHAGVSTIGQINDGTGVFGSFVAGSLTSIAQMEAFAALNPVAQYSGYGMYSGYGRVDNTITVNFGNAEWSGYWYGDLSIAASGKVAGNQLSSDTVNAFAPRSFPAQGVFTGTATGSINASFNGENASALIGVVDVVKDGTRVVGTFKNALIVP